MSTTNDHNTSNFCSTRRHDIPRLVGKAGRTDLAPGFGSLRETALGTVPSGVTEDGRPVYGMPPALNGPLAELLEDYIPPTVGDDYDPQVNLDALRAALGSPNPRVFDAIVPQRVTMEVELTLVVQRRRLIHMGFAIFGGHIYPISVPVDDIIVVSIEGEVVMMAGAVVETCVVLSVMDMTVPASGFDGFAVFVIEV